MTTMTSEELLEGFRPLPAEERVRVAGEIEAISIEEDDVYVPTPEQRADIERGLADVAAGRTMPLEEFRRTMLRKR